MHICIVAEVPVSASAQSPSVCHALALGLPACANTTPERVTDVNGSLGVLQALSFVHTWPCREFPSAVRGVWGGSLKFGVLRAQPVQGHVLGFGALRAKAHLTDGGDIPLAKRVAAAESGSGVVCHTGHGGIMAHLCSLFQSAVGHEYQSKLSKHCSQVDSVRGFGGKFGVQMDRVDQVSDRTRAAGSLPQLQAAAVAAFLGQCSSSQVPSDPMGLQEGCPDKNSQASDAGLCEGY